jgi:hypothetical protein
MQCYNSALNKLQIDVLGFLDTPLLGEVTNPKSVLKAIDQTHSIVHELTLNVNSYRSLCVRRLARVYVSRGVVVWLG